MATLLASQGAPVQPKRARFAGQRPSNLDSSMLARAGPSVGGFCLSETAIPARTIFRADIASLRAIAVSAVIGGHFFPTWVPGGFVGVDVFFVVSGFLMTQIIVTGLDEGRFSLRRFYAMRATRIVPVLLAVCGVLLVLGWCLLLPSEYAMLAREILASLGFVSNVLYWRHRIGYFSPSAHDEWLLHTWSLAVEWQFYLLFPLFLLGVWRWWPEHRRGIVLALCVAGFAVSLYVSDLRPTSRSSCCQRGCGNCCWVRSYGSTLSRWRAAPRWPLPLSGMR